MEKKIILGLVFLVMFCSFAFLVYADMGRQVKTILRKSLFEHSQHPIKTTLNRSEVIDLIVLYLEGDITDDVLSVAREHSGKSVRSIINKAVNNYGTEPGCAGQCGDGECADVVCTGTGCPCWETVESCPDDCEDAVVEECLDTDGGIVYEVQGTISGVSVGGLPYTYSDACNGDIITEWYCDETAGPKAETTYVCPNGCENGECKDAGEPDECSPEGVKECSEDGNFLKTCITTTAAQAGTSNSISFNCPLVPIPMCSEGSEIYTHIGEDGCIEEITCVQVPIPPETGTDHSCPPVATPMCTEGSEIQTSIGEDGCIEQITCVFTDSITLRGPASMELGNIGRLMWSTETCPDGCENGACIMIPLTCGDDVIDSDEECDGDDLGGATCLTISPHRYIGGTLSCANCQFDVSNCEINDSSNWQYPGGTNT